MNIANLRCYIFIRGHLFIMQACFEAFQYHQPTSVRTFSLYKVSKNRLFLDRPPTTMSFRSIKMVPYANFCKLQIMEITFHYLNLAARFYYTILKCSQKSYHLHILAIYLIKNLVIQKFHIHFTMVFYSTVPVSGICLQL